MKTNSLVKKLTLKRTVINNLNPEEMNLSRGGLQTLPPYLCRTEIQRTCDCY